MFKKLYELVKPKSKLRNIERPYFKLSSNTLESLFGEFFDDMDVLQKISFELDFRKTSRVETLKVLVEERLIAIKNTESATSAVGIKKRSDRGINENKIGNLTNFISFDVLVKKMTKSLKPEAEIDGDIWLMFVKSLKTSDLRYSKLTDAAKSLDLIWPATKINDEINDYLGLSFDQIKNDYGFEQKRVIISAVAIASYTKVQSWRLLKEKYGKNPQTDFNIIERESVPIVKDEPDEPIVNSQENMEVKKGTLFVLRGSKIDDPLDDITKPGGMPVVLPPISGSDEELSERDLVVIEDDCLSTQSESSNKEEISMEFNNRNDHNSVDSLFLNKIIYFIEVVNKISRSPKPEILIDSEIWKMFTKSLNASDLKYNSLKEVANSLDLVWSETKKDEEINDYIGLSYDQIKNNYGFEEKRVIITAVARASYENIKSWRLLNEKYGEKDQSSSSGLEAEKVVAKGRPFVKTVNVGVKSKAESDLKEKVTFNSSPYFYNSLLNFKAPWNCIKESTWDKWRKSIKQNQQMLTIADVAKYGKFQCNKNLHSITIGELLNFEFGYLDSFLDYADRRAVFYTVAFLGLGGNVSTEPQKYKVAKDKPVSIVQHAPEIHPPIVSFPENDTMDEILGDFGL